jgi:hypothetical protein
MSFEQQPKDLIAIYRSSANGEHIFRGRWTEDESAEPGVPTAIADIRRSLHSDRHGQCIHTEVDSVYIDR